MVAAGRVARGSAYGGALALLCALVIIGASTSSAQGPQPPADEESFKLRIASMHVAGKQIGPVQLEEPQPVWRHTFGSERRADAPRQPVRFSADIVVLQGVTNLAPVRQMFPARFYHIVVSRQILQNSNPTRQGPEAATTALAIRRDTGLRVVDNDHLLKMADSPPDSGLQLAAATAVRLVSRRRALWAMSLDLVQGCPEQPEAGDVRCEAAKRQLDAVDAWVSERLAAGEFVIVAGRFHRVLDNASLPGSLSRLYRFPSREKLAGECQDDGSIATTYVLARPGPEPAVELNVKGHLEPVDEKKPEYGCLLMVDLSF